MKLFSKSAGQISEKCAQNSARQNIAGVVDKEIRPGKGDHRSEAPGGEAETPIGQKENRSRRKSGQRMPRRKGIPVGRRDQQLHIGKYGKGPRPGNRIFQQEIPEQISRRQAEEEQNPKAPVSFKARPASRCAGSGSRTAPFGRPPISTPSAVSSSKKQNLKIF